MKSATAFAAAVRTLSYPLSPATAFKLSHNEETRSSENVRFGVIVHLLTKICTALQIAMRVDHTVAIGISVLKRFISQIALLVLFGSIGGWNATDAIEYRFALRRRRLPLENG